jgi:hypothetical protein
MSCPGIRRSLKDAVLLPLLFVLVLRAFVPAGYMPARADDGFMRLVMCSAGWQLPGAGHGPDSPSTSDHSPCPFAGNGNAPIPVAPLQWIPADTMLALVAPTFVTLPGNIAPLRHAAPRGPPASTTSNN